MPSFGENLRRERELRGVSLREIADETKISIRFLQALEQDRVDVLPGGLFRRTFVRQYARHVGLDPERVVAEFIYAHGDETPPVAFRAPEGRKFPTGTLLTVVGLLALGLVSFSKSSSKSRTAKPKDDVAQASSIPAVTLPVDHVYPAAQPQPREERPGDVQNLVLTLSARESCWVAVQVDGQTVLNRVLAGGETETLQAQGEIVLSVGNAGGLSFRVNDRPGVSLGRAGEVKRNIVITRKNLPELVEDHSS
jgi:cytoskeleton protein RodZ